MNRPGAITTSIVVMFVLVAIGAIVCFMMLTVRPGIAKDEQPLAVVLVWLSTLIAPMAAGIVNIIGLFLRKRWAYWLNLVLIFFTILLLIAAIVMPVVVHPIKGFGGMPIAMSVLIVIPAGLLVWLSTELIRNRQNSSYFSADQAANRTAPQK